MTDRESRIARVCGFLTQRGVAFDLRRLAENTATSAAAAAALQCDVAEIAKSVVFRQTSEGDDGCCCAVVCILCGDDRVDTSKLARLAGAPVQKADADFVKTQCGFEIGGVAPVAHCGADGSSANVRVFLEARLQRFATIWAAAGSAYAVFGIRPADLAACVQSDFSDFAVASS